MDTVAPDGSQPHDAVMEARVAVLEEIAATTKSMLAEVRADIKSIREKQETDYRGLHERISATELRLYEKISATELRLYLAGGAVAAGLAALMAKGFRWF